MRNQKKVEILRNRIETLEQRNKELKKQNEILEQELQNNKITVLSKMQELKDKESKLIELQSTYKVMISKFKRAVDDYEQIRKISYNTKAAYEKEFKKILHDAKKKL